MCAVCLSNRIRYYPVVSLSCDLQMCSLPPVRYMIPCPIIDQTISQPAELRVIPRSSWLKMAVNSLPESQMHFKSPLSHLKHWCFPAVTVAITITSRCHFEERFVELLKTSPSVCLCKVQHSECKAKPW